MANEQTIIGPTITISGELRSEEDISVQGKVVGRVETSADLNVEDTGEFEAEVVTRNIDIRGRVVGNVTASDRFEIHSGGSVTGDIHAPRVVLNDGCKYKGHIETADAQPARLRE